VGIRGHNTNSGLALLIVVGVLGLLAVLATAFVTMAQLERRASAQRLHATKAGLLARSGIEDALARLSAGQEALYGGEDWNGDGVLNAGPQEQGSEVYRPGTLDTDACPVRHALRPSFFAADGTGQPRRLRVDGRDRGYSGVLPGGAAGAYTMKVTGEDGIHVNGGDLSSAGEHPGTYDTILKRILGNLAEELGLARAMGEALVTARPAGGWRNKEQIRRMAQAAGLATQADLILPYVTCVAWVDRKVIKPNIDPNWAVPAGGYAGSHVLAGQTPAAWTEIRVGKRDTPVPVPLLLTPGGVMPGIGVTGTGSLWSGKRAFNPHTNSYAPDFEPRAPVNLNWAKDHPLVLKALLRDLAGIYLDASWMNASRWGTNLFEKDYGCLGIFYKAALGPAEATLIANACAAHAGFPTWTVDFPDWDQTAAFDSWDEFSRFVDLKLPALSQPQRDLLKANFNPNSDLNKFNPGETVFKHVDKSDLTLHSTEFSFRTPLRSLSSTGRLTDGTGRMIAERTLSTGVLFEQVRLTTQSEFCAGDLGDLDIAGDETGARLPGDPGFLAETGSPDKAFGSRHPGTPRGFALQTYPEPQVWGSGCPAPAAYDGGLQLATLETEATQAANPGLTFLASWDSGYDATWGAGSTTCNQDVGQGPVSASLLGDGQAAPRAALNMLYPDGCYAEAWRCPGYEAKDNLGDGLQGLMSVWYKPAFGPDFGPVANAFVLNRAARGFCLVNLGLLGVDPLPGNQLAIMANSQVLILGGSRYGAGKTLFGAITERYYDLLDHYKEQGPSFGWTQTDPSPRTYWHAHRWHLITWQWNLNATTIPDYCAMRVDGAAATSTARQYYHTGATGVPAYGTTLSLTRDAYRDDGSFGIPYFYLGDRGFVLGMLGSTRCCAADGTLDEFACVTRSTSMTETDVLQANRFPIGRYVKEEAALDPSIPEFMSCAIPLPPGSRLIRADWTLVLPRAFPSPPSAPDLGPVPNRAFYGTGSDPLAGSTAEAGISLLSGPGVSLLQARLTRSGSPVSVSLPDGIFKLGIDIRPRLGDNTGAWSRLSTPLLESPVLDDITVTYTPRGGPRTTTWKEGD
jgi:hypothetical protein